MRIRASATGRYVVLSIAAAISVFPILVAIDTMMKSDTDVFGVQRWFPRHGVSLSNVKDVLLSHELWSWLLNSLIIAAGVSALTLLISIPAAHALARGRLPGSRVYLNVILISQTIAPAVLIVPLFRLIREVGLLNTFTAVILVSGSFVLPFAIWLLTAFFTQVPAEIEEAASLDGSTGLSFLIRFMVPISVPGIAATGVWAFIHGWNEYLIALTFLSGDTSKWPVTIGISANIGQYSVAWQRLMATALIGTIPVIILFRIFRRQLEAGIGKITVG